MKKNEKATMYIGLGAIGLAVIAGLYLRKKRKETADTKEKKPPLAADINFGI